MLKDDMRVINNTQDFEAAITRFLEWRREREAGLAEDLIEAA
jgi:hypothetical protein